LEDGPVELLPLAKDKMKFKLCCYDPKVFKDHITKTRSPHAVVIDNPNSSELWPCTPAIMINDKSDTPYGEDFNYDEVSHAMYSVTLNSPPKTSTPLAQLPPLQSPSPKLAVKFIGGKSTRP